MINLHQGVGLVPVNNLVYIKTTVCQWNNSLLRNLHMNQVTIVT